jgi:hypothetical protein
VHALEIELLVSVVSGPLLGALEIAQQFTRVGRFKHLFGCMFVNQSQHCPTLNPKLLQKIRAISTKERERESVCVCVGE